MRGQLVQRRPCRALVPENRACVRPSSICGQSGGPLHPTATGIAYESFQFIDVAPRAASKYQLAVGLHAANMRQDVLSALGGACFKNGLNCEVCMDRAAALQETVDDLFIAT